MYTHIYESPEPRCSRRRRDEPPPAEPLLADRAGDEAEDDDFLNEND